MQEAQQKEAELTEHISRLRAELISKDKEIQEKELEKLSVKWSSSEAKWWKILLLQRIYLKQKL